MAQIYISTCPCLYLCLCICASTPYHSSILIYVFIYISTLISPFSYLPFSYLHSLIFHSHISILNSSILMTLFLYLLSLSMHCGICFEFCTMSHWSCLFLHFSDFATVKGSQSFFRRSLEKVHASKKCPLCARGFADEAGLERVIKSVSKIEAHVFDGTSRKQPS